MARISDIDKTRRQLLISLLAAGTFSSLPASSAQLSRLPSKLQPGQFIYRFSGDVHINDVPATLTSVLKLGDVVTTGAKSFVIFVFEKDAFILRSNSAMTIQVGQSFGNQEKEAEIKTAGLISSSYSLKRGKLLSVLASRTTSISTPSAVVRIRGTGVYVEAEPEESYVCVCYGETDIESPLDSGVRETVVTKHHDAPKYVFGGNNPRIEPAPFKNHDDQELLLIETLVGRTTPYFVPQGVPRTRSGYF